MNGERVGWMDGREGETDGWMVGGREGGREGEMDGWMEGRRGGERAPSCSAPARLPRAHTHSRTYLHTCTFARARARTQTRTFAQAKHKRTHARTHARTRSSRRSTHRPVPGGRGWSAEPKAVRAQSRTSSQIAQIVKRRAQSRSRTVKNK